MSYELASVVMPVYRQAGYIADIIRSHEAVLTKLPTRHETILVVNGPDDGTLAACHRLGEEFDTIRILQSEPGWGRAVKTGLAAVRGDLVCYTNSARTSSPDLLLILLYAIANPGTVVKANRKTRDNWRRRLGSLLYNLECRSLFDLSNFDVNGTPKAFPRAFEKLLTPTRDDDLIDAEFNWICRREGYPMLEVPIVSTTRHGGRSTTGYSSAVKMYLGAYRLWREGKTTSPRGS